MEEEIDRDMQLALMDTPAEVNESTQRGTARLAAPAGPVRLLPEAPGHQ
jgi:hypothetical protein